MTLNKEKLEILDHKGDTLVIANPGTGKTLLLAHKYIKLIKEGIKPTDILCLTFTKKAKKEMEERIIHLLEGDSLAIDYANLNVFTFHAYALEQIGRDETIPANLLRYAIYRYFRENELLRYGDDYLIDTIVPKMENLIRYLKSFGVLPDDIDIQQVKNLLGPYKNLSKEEMDKFAESFIDVYRHYEQVKKEKGIDYADMLIDFLKIKNKRRFKYVLIDELQDVNTMEAEIALESGETFFAVGDKKQAIFGFQGGSVLNFKKFSKAKTFVLSENFRSTSAILDFSRKYLVSKTKDALHREELKDLRNPRKGGGKKPTVYEVASEDSLAAVGELTNRLMKEHEKIAIIARTNFQILKISQELQRRGIDHSSTYFSASDDARTHTIGFLRGVLSNDIDDVVNSMFTPFFPIPIQDAFELTKQENLTINDIFEKSPDFKHMRESVKTIEDVNALFRTRILPVATAYGKEYLLAALAMQKAFNEALSALDKISYWEVISYLKSSDLLVDESDVEKKVVLTTVHKAKGRQFPAVIYVPRKTRDSDNFQDEVVKAILKTKGIDAEEELNEEALRISFVALTRAEESLHIIPDKIEDYINEASERQPIEVKGTEGFELAERLKRAYALFVNGDVEGSGALLNEKRGWIRNFVKKHFEGLDHVSFSSLETDPCEYIENNLLGIREYAPSLSLGSEVHTLAEAILKGESYNVTEKTAPYADNIKQVITEVKLHYPETVLSEQLVKIPLDQLIGTGAGVEFVGYIDAIFKNDDSYLILDWKTDKNDSRGSEHRQQLEAYRRAYAKANGIQLEKIKIAIGYVGLRTTVNLGTVDFRLDQAQPAKSAFETLTRKINQILLWKKDPDSFLKALAEKDCEHLICKAVIEEFKREVMEDSTG
ncbi:ATP-dependent helicase [Candidatus Micrarchaeota archaeon]|nr:ATP-dependent helicase [Candidatus Micrarchaeota archaeon]